MADMTAEERAQELLGKILIWPNKDRVSFAAKYFREAENAAYERGYKDGHKETNRTARTRENQREHEKVMGRIRRGLK